MSNQKFTTDSQILCDYLISKIHKDEKILDIGCGEGDIDFIITKNQKITLTGIDINNDAIAIASGLKYGDRNNTFINTEFICTSLSEFSKDSKYNNYFDRIITNPPFYKTNSSRPPSDIDRRISRLDESLSLEDIFIYSKKLLKDKGFLNFIYPTENLIDIIMFSAKYKIQTVEIIPIYTKLNHEAKRILIQCRKNVAGIFKIEFPNLYYKKFDL